MSPVKYDLIVVGSGLYGAVVAQQAKEHYLRCLVLERRQHIGGNIRDEWIDGICVHQYGAHIFHTDDERVWAYVNRFSRFAPYIHTVLAHSGKRMFHLPFSLQTFYDVYGICRPDEISEILRREHKRESYQHPTNLEEQAINLVGRTLYELLIKGYTEKQWGRKASELPSNLITRLPVRETFDNRYFNDRYQGIPEEGYSKMIERMLEGIEVRTGVDFLENRDYWIARAKEVVYTGTVDELMDYRLGELGYRSLRFETERLQMSNYQGMAVINETGVKVPYTRTIEHKHFYYKSQTPHTIITREYPLTWERGREPYYAMNSEQNNRLYDEYCRLTKTVYPTIRLGGRLGWYQYFDMDDVVAMALLVEYNFTSRQTI